MKTLWKYAALLAIALVVSSCEKEKGGLVDSTVQTPVLSSASVSPALVNLDVPADNISHSGSTYRIRLAVSGLSFAHGGPAVSRVSYRVSAPGSTAQIASGTLHMSASGDSAIFQDSISITAGRNDIGKYLVNVTAFNTAGLPSGTLQQSFYLTRANSKPRVSNLAVPDTIIRPNHGIDIYAFTVAATDSDGYSDIESVTGRRIAPSVGRSFGLADDGNISLDGDRILGDGTFSVIVKIDSTAFLGNQTFLFQAMDKSGAVSDSLLHRITIVHQ